MKVPLDWNKPNSSGSLAVTVSRIPSTSGHPRGVLFTNFGGPGYPRGFAYPVFWYYAKPEIVDAYDVVGMDIRGSGSSTPVFCNAFNFDGPADPRNRNPEAVAGLEALSQASLAHCVDPAGDLTQYMTPYQTVRDVDLLRTLLGRTKLSYFGISAGTLLGSWYAATFPSRVDRFVLDGNVDLTSTWFELQAAWPRTVQRKLEADFLPWMASYQRVYHYGSTGAKALATWEARRAALVRQPLVVSPGCTIRAADFDQTTYLYLAYDGVDGAPITLLAQGLSILEHFNSATAEERQFVADLFVCQQDPEDSGDSGPAAIGWLCGDTQAPPYDAYQALSVNLGAKYPLLGPTAENLNGACAFWPFPVTGRPHVPAHGLPLMLMVNNDGDPLTPLDGAQHAAAAYRARLLVVTDESHHTIYGLGDDCADGYIDGYLLTGALPAAGTTCPGLPMPIPDGA
jgi:pimeloyl-ACP methyl ester carboxylesterase